MSAERNSEALSKEHLLAFLLCLGLVQDLPYGLNSLCRAARLETTRKELARATVQRAEDELLALLLLVPGLLQLGRLRFPS